MARRKAATEYGDSIRVGPVDVALRVVPRAEMAPVPDGELFGYFQIKTMTIAVADDLEHWAQLQTLMHEVAHALLHVYLPARLPPEVEESVVEAIGWGLMGLIRDNPRFIDTLLYKMAE